jgi:hypothetical protein
MTDALDKARQADLALTLEEAAVALREDGNPEYASACIAAKQRIAELEAMLAEAKSVSWDILIKEKAQAHQAGFLACQKAAAAMVLRAKYQHPTPIEAELNRLVDKIAQAISELKPEGE